MTVSAAGGIALLAKLYSYYEEFGTLLGGAKYINLRDPQETIPRPTDKY
jgi:hypothetical protein